MIIRFASIKDSVPWFSNGDGRETEGSQLTIIVSFPMLKCIGSLWSLEVLICTL